VNNDLIAEEGHSLPCVVQDPEYSTVDKELLHSIGLACVSDPAAFLIIDSGSLVLSIGTEWSLCKKISLGVWPAALVCSDLVNADTIYTQAASESYRQSTIDMVVECEKQPFAASIAPHVIYWREKGQK
jgi:hypothetical protein